MDANENVCEGLVADYKRIPWECQVHTIGWMWSGGGVINGCL